MRFVICVNINTTTDSGLCDLSWKSYPIDNISSTIIFIIKYFITNKRPKVTKLNIIISFL